MNPKILKTLEFEKIKKLLQESTRTVMGREEVNQLTPISEAEAYQFLS